MIKRIITTSLLGFLLVMVLFIGLSGAAEEMLSATVTSITTAIDRNGNEYTRAIISEDKKLQGVEYTMGLPVMFFGENAIAGKALQVGDKFKAIVAPREFQGRKSYTVIKLVE